MPVMQTKPLGHCLLVLPIEWLAPCVLLSARDRDLQRDGTRKQDGVPTSADWCINETPYIHGFLACRNRRQKMSPHCNIARRLIRRASRLRAYECFVDAPSNFRRRDYKCYLGSMRRMANAEQEEAERDFRASINFQHAMADRNGYVVEPHEPEVSSTPDPGLDPNLLPKPTVSWREVLKRRFESIPHHEDGWAG